MLSTFLLILKFTVTVFIQGGKRFEGGSRPPEDEKFKKSVNQNFGLKKDAPTDEKMKQAIETDMRWQRIVLNDLENIPLGLIVAWASVFSPLSEWTHVSLVASFTLARVFHTYAYANGLQPHRALLWTAGILSVLGMGLNGTLGVFLNSKL